MSSAKVSEIPAETKVMAPITVSDPVFITTDCGAVTVYGHEHVSKKDLIILGYCLNLPEFSKEMAPNSSNHNVKSVIFRTDNRPKDDKGEPILANCAFDPGAITVNLLQTVTMAIEDAMKNNEVSILASYHRNMIMNFLHEIHHLSTLDEVPKDPEMRDMVEEDAQVWATDCLVTLAKSKDIEPAHHAESSFLAGQLMELLAENKDPWAIEQRHYLDNHIMYLLPATDEKKEMAFYTFKGYIQIMSGDVTSKDWNKETILGAGALNPFEAAIRAVSEVIPAMPTPASAMANTSPIVNNEYIEMEEDHEWQYAEAGPIMEDEHMFPIGEVPATPMSVVGLSPTPTPAFTGFPIGNVAPATPTPMPTPQVMQAPPIYPTTGLTGEQTAAIVMALYQRCYEHIFTNCGRLLNSDQGFSNFQMVHTTPLKLTEHEMRVVMKMDCLDPNGRWCPNMPTSGGLLFGGVMKNTNLPYYKLYINMDGQEIVRLLLPQNPATRKSDGQYKDTAIAARRGSCIMYVMEGNDAVTKAGGKKYLWKNVDNQWTRC